MKTEIDASTRHINKITKKYVIDMFNALIFSNSVLWDGDDQFNELPIFSTEREGESREEQRGAIFVSKKTSNAVRLLVSVDVSINQRVCYRVVGLKTPVRIDSDKQLYYPFEGHSLDVSVADLNLGKQDPTSYSFYDNTNPTGEISNSRLFTLVSFVTSAAFIALDKKEVFDDLLLDELSIPPAMSSPHYKPVFGAMNAEAYFWDRS